MPVTAQGARSTLAAMRLTIGFSALLAPRLAAKLFALDPDANPQAPFLGRLFGVRNAAIGLTLRDGAPAEQQRWLRYGVAIDVIDIAALAAAGARGTIPKRAVALIGVTASVATALGIAAQRNS
jgi:hypothetical protein